MVEPGGKNQAGESAKSGKVLDCEQWEALLADKMDLEDGMLAPEIESAFAEHSRTCPGCGDLLDQARQGQQWLKLLEASTPAAPVDLLSRILAKTQGAGREADYAIGMGGLGAAGGGAGVAAQGGRWSIPFLPSANAGMVAARGAHNARMLMTAGMAFFSVALTLSVAGVRLTSVHAAELRPQVVQANVSRSFYGTKKQVVSFYENLRLVYEVESKMHDIRHDSEPAPAQREALPAPQGGSQGGQQAVPRSTPKLRQGPAGSGHAATQPQQEQPVFYGSAMSVRYLQAPPRLRFERASLGRETGAGWSARLGGVTSKERNRT